MARHAAKAISGGVHGDVVHDSAHKHVNGAALYVDDIPEPPGLLHAAFGQSARAHARIKDLDLAPVWAAPGVTAVIAAGDVPGANNIGPVVPDEPIFAEGLVEFVGQCLFAVAAETLEEARRAARLAVVDYKDLKPIFTVAEAMAAKTFVLPPHRMKRAHDGVGGEHARQHVGERCAYLGGVLHARHAHDARDGL